MNLRLVSYLVIAVLVALAGPVGMAHAQSTFVGAWPYQIPPTGHFNTYVTDNISMGAYWDLIESPMAMYRWADDSWLPLLATDWEFDVDNQRFSVQLREGVVFEDGSEFTSYDVVTTFRLGYLMNLVVWRYLERVEADGPYTVHFYMDRPSTLVQQYVLREKIRASSVYGQWGDRVEALLAEGLDRESEEMRRLLGEFLEFRPERLVATGPYTIDPDRLTESQATLPKVVTAFNADRVNFDQIVLYNGETPAVTPLVLARQVDYATHGFPVATEMQFIAQGTRVIRPPTYSGPALYFNHNIYPFNRAEFRRAVAYAIDRHENGVISLSDSGRAAVLMAGMPDSMAELWLDEETLAQLEPYATDRAKAEQILLDIGFSKGNDGVWIDDQGNRLSFELSHPAEFADWSAAAENLAEQLRNFGLDIRLRGVPHTQHPIDVNMGRFEMAIRGWGASNPHPHFSFVADMFTHNYPQAQEGDGMNFNLNVTSERFGEVDLEELVVASAEGLSEAEQAEMVKTVSLVFNELLPIIPLWERFGNNPVLEDVRVSGWPADDDPSMLNPPYNDPVIVLLLLEGTLRPAN